jgi:hypothetical protein
MLSRVLRGIKNIMAVTAVAAILFAIAVPGNVSGIEARQELLAGNIVYGQDFCDAGLSQTLFHSQTLAVTNDNSLGISFPVTTVPGPGDQASQIVSPSISQTCDNVVTATSTGFYDAASDTCPDINLGAAPIGVGQFAAPIPVTRAKFSSNALMYPEMVVQGNMPGSPATDISLPPAEAGITFDRVAQLATREEDKGATGFDARDAGMPVILSSRTIDGDAGPDQINQTSIVERLWRNTHQGNVMDYVFEGSVARPTWIMPVKNPYILIGCGGGLDSIKASLRLTRPGTFLYRSFWSL